jgi:uncharacterized membrane protein YgcG
VTRHTHDTRLAAQSTPEMLRLPLDNALLQALAMAARRGHSGDGGDLFAPAARLLAQCPSPPPADSVARARDALLQLDALTPTRRGPDGDALTLTALGRLLARLPLAPRLGKLLVAGRLLQCTLPALAVAAALSTAASVASLFVARGGSDGDARASQAAVAAAQETLLRAYAPPQPTGPPPGPPLCSDFVVVAAAVAQFLATPPPQRRAFCRAHALHFDRLRDVADAVADLADDLRDCGLLRAGLVAADADADANGDADGAVSHAAARHAAHASRESLLRAVCDPRDATFNRHAQRPRLLAAVTTAALYPAVAQVQRPPKKFVAVAGGAVERDVLAKEVAFYVPVAAAGLDPALLPPLPALPPTAAPGAQSERDARDARDVDDAAALAAVGAGGFMRLPDAAAATLPPATAALLARERRVYFSACVVRRSDVAAGRVARVFVHPSSANFANGAFAAKHRVASNYVLFGDLQRVVTGYDAAQRLELSRLTLRDTSEVTPVALVLFGGALRVQPLPPDAAVEAAAAAAGGAVGDRVLLSVDDWIRFYCSRRDAALLVALRAALDRVLAAQLPDADADTDDDDASSVASQLSALSLVSGGGGGGGGRVGGGGGGSGGAVDGWRVHPLLEAACALLDSAVTSTGAISSGISVAKI